MVRPRYSVTTEADEPRNFSAISSTAATLSDRAIPCLLSVVGVVVHVTDPPSTDPGEDERTGAGAHGAWQTAPTSAPCGALVLLRGPPACRGTFVRRRRSLTGGVDLRSSVEPSPRIRDGN